MKGANVVIESREMPRSIDDKPYIEILDGRRVPKVSPKRRHAILQWRIAARLQNLAGDRGDVGTEWRCWLDTGGPKVTTLVPDVAFVSNERLAPLTSSDREEPPFAPDVAIEIRSPGDRIARVEWKMRAYLAHGSIVAMDVLPDTREIRIFTLDGVRSYREEDRYESTDLPWLAFDVSAVFAPLTS
jgi:Uma2 family endonuclease